MVIYAKKQVTISGTHYTFHAIQWHWL